MNDFFSFIFNFRVPLFYLSIILLIILNKRKFEVQSKFIFLYRTKLGLKSMDYIAKKYNKTVKALAKLGVWTGYLGFVFITFMLVKLLISLLQKPDTIGVSPVIPGIPIAGTGLVFPLIIGWISLLIIMVVHEFAHGVVARAYKQRVLSSGLAFFGPILGAFVEPDEKQIIKQNKNIQNSIYAAGPFANIILTVITTLMLLFVVTPLLQSFELNPVGLEITPMPNMPTYNASLEEKTIITKINYVDITSAEQFYNQTLSIHPGDIVTFETEDQKIYTINTIKNPNNESLGYMGIYIQGMKYQATTKLLDLLYRMLKWIATLLFWTALISINIGLINLYPIYITDGARMLKIHIEARMKNKKKAENLWIKLNNYAVLILLAIITVQLFNWIIMSI